MDLKKLLGTEEEPGWTIRPVILRGKPRVLHMPNSAMRRLHHILRDDLSALRYVMCVNEFWRGASQTICRFLYPHEKGRFLYHLDLADAYQCVDGDKLIAALLPELTGVYRTDIARLFGKDLELVLRLACLTADQCLVTGGPSSSILFDLYLGTYLDAELQRLAEIHRLTYTRYADNLLFSRTDRRIGKRVRKQINDLVRNAGFRSHPRKTVAYDLNRRAQVVLGVGLRWHHRRRRLIHFVPRHTRDRIRGLLHLGELGRLDQSGLDQLHGLIGFFLAISKAFYDNGWNHPLAQRYRAFTLARRNGRPKLSYNHPFYTGHYPSASPFY